MKVNLTANKYVYNFGKPYIIAELASNHNGDMEIAKQLILAAKEAGADCVKFQSWSKNTIFSKQKYLDNCFIGDDYRGRDDYTLEEIVEEFSVSEEQLLIMKKYADSLEIDFTSTPFSNREADFLVDDLDAPFIKVASMDLNNYPFLDYVARKGRPVMISTGLSQLYEIDKAIRTIENAGNNEIVILHCVALYPPQDEDINLNNIVSLRNLYPYPIGFSDHTLGYSVPLAATALGASVIEKHITLDKEMFGWDHKVSAMPDEMKIIVNESLRISKALGSHRISCVEDASRRNEFRRSIVVTRDLKVGDVISREDCDFKRPGTGIQPGEIGYVVGRKLKRDIESDQILSWNDFI